MQFLESSVATSAVHMQKDALLIEQDRDAPLLHTYGWEGPAITYGHFISIEKYIDIKEAASLGVSLGKRPTGGGLLFHEHDIAFSLFIPRGHKAYSSETMANYYWINNCTKEAIEQFLLEKGLSLIDTCSYEKNNPYIAFCYATPTKYDLLLRGKKVGGCAQRNTKKGLLHQASIFFTKVETSLLERVVFDKEAIHSMRENSESLLSEPMSEKERKRFIEILQNIFSRYLE